MRVSPVPIRSFCRSKISSMARLQGTSRIFCVFPDRNSMKVFPFGFLTMFCRSSPRISPFRIPVLSAQRTKSDSQSLISGAVCRIVAISALVRNRGLRSGTFTGRALSHGFLSKTPSVTAILRMARRIVFCLWTVEGFIFDSSSLCHRSISCTVISLRNLAQK